MDITINGISKCFGQMKVLDGLSFTFAEGRTTAVTGPSGCGKTTLLNIIAGLECPDSGFVGGTTGRRISYAFQEPRLLPWKSVLDNVTFVLPDDMDPEEKKERAMGYLEMTELADAAGEMPPRLSGGMAQRACLARALAFDGDIMLLDEPFASVDIPATERIMTRLGRHWSERRTTVIMITHSADEVSRCDDVLELNNAGKQSRETKQNTTL